jgi:flavin reductase (DIM6/NTAB) family NADH-FMN oxidoreductase RutF
MVADLKLVTEPAPERAPAPEFADAMSALASGVVVVTSLVGGRPWGMTATAFTSISADPPTVLVSLGSNSASASAIKQTGQFGVSILAEDQQGIARYCSTPGSSKLLADLVVPGALAHLDCELSNAVEAADHTVFFGRVRDAQVFDDSAPLVYHRRAYRTVSDLATGRKVRCLSN